MSKDFPTVAIAADHSFADRVKIAVMDVTGPPPVALHEPCLTGNEARYVEECIKSTFVSSVGKFVDRFEAELAAYTGSRHAIAVVNGTAALHVALLLSGVRPHEEVIVPALTFVATVNSVRYCGAIPHFADSDERTLGLDPIALREWLTRTTFVDGNGACINRETERRIRAVVPMHAFGHPCEMEGIASLADEFGFQVVEDAAESLGSVYKGRHAGTFGRLGALSFNGNKIVTAGGGGAIITDDANLASRAKHLTTTAKLPHPWAYEHDEVGFNYRMPNLNAALGCAQLEQIPEFLASKRRLHKRYRSAFDSFSNVQLVSEPAGCQSNYWLQTLLLHETIENERDNILASTNAAGIMTRPAWTLMHHLVPYRDCPRAPLPVAESLARRIINLPSSAGLA